MNQKQQKPTLSGQRFKTRKRGKGPRPGTALPPAQDRRERGAGCRVGEGSGERGRGGCRDLGWRNGSRGPRRVFTAAVRSSKVAGGSGAACCGSCLANGV